MSYHLSASHTCRYKLINLGDYSYVTHLAYILQIIKNIRGSRIAD